MRKVAIGAVVGVLALVGASVALATGTVQKFTDTFSTKAKGKSTSMALKLSSSDMTNGAHNNAPDPARRVVLAWPKGTVLQPTAIPACSATATDFQSKGTGACPAKTKIGTGTASANTTFPSVGEIHATVTAFNGTKKQLDIYVQPSPGAPAQPFLIVGQLSGSKRAGFKLTTNPPPSCLPPGTAAQGCPNGEAPLDSFNLTTLNRTGKVHGHKVGFMTSPTKCPKSKNWTFIVTITFKTDGTKTYRSNSPCKA